MPQSFGRFADLFNLTLTVFEKVTIPFQRFPPADNKPHYLKFRGQYPKNYSIIYIWKKVNQNLGNNLQ